MKACLRIQPSILYDRGARNASRIMAPLLFIAQGCPCLDTSRSTIHCAEQCGLKREP